MDQARVDIDATVGLHLKARCFFCGLMHFGVTLTVRVLRRARRGNSGGINYRALLEQITLCTQLRVHCLQTVPSKLVLFQ